MVTHLEPPFRVAHERRAALPRTSRPSIAHVVLNLNPGGTERLVIELARQLADDFQPVVCCLDQAGEWSAELSTAGIDVVALGRRPGFRPTLGWQLRQIVDRYKARVLHCHHYSPFVYSALASLGSNRRRIVYTEHGRLSDAPPTLKRRLVNPWLGRIPSQIVAVSGDLRHHMIAEGLPANRIRVIHNGIAPAAVVQPADRWRARARLGIPEMAFVVGTLARLDAVKDLPTMIQGFAALRQTCSAARLVIVGDGPDRNAVMGAALKAGVLEHVMLTGYRADARALLAAFDVYVNTSVTEGISLTILEAMAAGLPVVATRVGGTPEIIVDGQTGILMPARNPAVLAEVLRMLAESPARRQTLGDGGFGRVRAAFSIDRMIGDYAKLYSALAAGTVH